MKKKFAVKVCYFASGYYSIKYCSYYLFPLFWKTLLFWFQQSPTAGTETWSTELFKGFSEAEEVASRLKSMQDVKDYYRSDEEKMRKFYEEKKKYYENNVPYQNKRIR